MLRHVFAATSLVCVLSSLSARALGVGAWVPSGPFQPIEQRVAVAVGPSRTTLWTSLRFESASGPVGIVVPAPSGASLDVSSDAWFEALEVATAPRIFPPNGISPHCPGYPGPENVFEIVGGVGHVKSLKIEDLAVLDDAAAVSAWAQQGGLLLSPAVEGSLQAISGVRFVGVRFQAPGGPAVTPTLRIAMPGAPPLLPLSLTRAASEDLRVTAWLFGDGRVNLSGATKLSVPSESLTWDAKAQKSNYDDKRSLTLSAAGAEGTIIECANHEALSQNLSIANGTASIDGLVTTFFERAAAYGDAAVDPSSCILKAAVALASGEPVSASCARADLGIVDGGAPCVESPVPGEVDPARLRCDGVSDDLAVALSGLAPADAWLNRQTLQIPAGKAGASFSLSFISGNAVSPVRVAGIIDVGDCSDQGSGTSTGSGAGSSSSSSSGTSTGSGAGPISSGGTPGAGAGQSGGGGGDEGSSGDFVDPSRTLDASCDCSGVPGDTGGDSCDSGDTGGDSCDSGDTGGDSCDGGEGDVDCSDSSYDGDTCDSGGDVDCSGGGGDIDCSGGGGEDCAISGKSAHKRRAPRLSPIALGVLALLAPLRRRGRRGRRPAGQ
jgi:hypothetical protein